MNLSKILNKDKLSKSDLLSLLAEEDTGRLASIFAKANEVKRQYCTDEIQVSGLIEFSNFCEEKCKYCTIGSGSGCNDNFRMDPEEVISLANQISNNGIKSVILQSGSDHYFDSDLISYIVFSIRKKTNIDIILNIGRRDIKEYRNWNLSGASVYMMKYPIAKGIIAQDGNLSRLEILKRDLNELKESDMKLGVSTMVGLPNNTLDDLADLILLMCEMQLENASFTPYLTETFPGNRTNNRKNHFLTLKAIAVSRIVLKNSKISALPIAFITENQRNERGFNIGSNLLITDFTPLKYKEFQKATLCNQFSKHYSKIPSFTTNISIAE